MIVQVDETLCKACGECVRECARHLSIPSGAHVDHTHPRCGRCLHCYAVCPNGAIQLTEDGIQMQTGPERPRAVKAEDLAYLLAFRRSVRRFKNKAVPRETIERVLAAARHIPSGGNRHAYQFTVLTDPAVRERLSAEFIKVYDRKRRMLNNTLLKAIVRPFVDPYTRAFLDDPTYSKRMQDLLDCFSGGDDPIFYHAPAVILIHSKELIPTPKEDAILAGYNIVLMAQSLALGTCFVTLAEKAINGSAKCKAILGLSPEDTVHAVVLLGYQDVRYRRPVPKMPRPARFLS